jgi:hypothetical protein
LAENVSATRSLLAGSAGFADDGNLREQVLLAETALRLQGRVVLTLDEANEVREITLSALRQTDLIMLGGDLHENVLPTLQLEGVAQVLQRSKRARVLAHPDPKTALLEIERIAGPGLITHIITGAPLNSDHQLWYTSADLVKADQIAEALNQIWLRRTQMRGAPQPISGNLYG